MRLERLDRGGEVVEQDVHVVAVRGVSELHPPREHLSLGQRAQQRLELYEAPGHNRGRRAVLAAHLESRVPEEQGLHGLAWKLDNRHAAVTGSPLRQTAAGADDANALFER